MKPVSLNQLLFHPKCDTLSFYRPPKAEEDHDIDAFLTDMQLQLQLQGKEVLALSLEKNFSNIKKIIKGQPSKSHGFFFAADLNGYITLNASTEAFCVIGQTFHVRPLLEELFINPEFLVVNVSLYDIKVYRGDFQHLEIIQHYEFDQLPKGFLEIPHSRLYTPKHLGLLPYKTLLALKTISHKIQDTARYNSFPVIVTGLGEIRDIFLRYFDSLQGAITSCDEDFYEQTCSQVLEKCRTLRPLIIDFYSAQLKDRLKRMIKSKKLLSDLGPIIKAVGEGKVLHLVLPIETKLWGNFDLISGQYELHKRVQKNSSVDILNELAEEVMKQGGGIQFLRPHFFPQDSHVLAILRG